MYICIHTFICISLSLSLYIYILLLVLSLSLLLWRHCIIIAEQLALAYVSVRVIKLEIASHIACYHTVSYIIS